MATAVEIQLQKQSAAIGVLNRRTQALVQLANQLAADLAEAKNRPISISEQIDAIPGRRIETVLSGEIGFTEINEGQKGQPIVIGISQDGPFIQTHYPMLLWYPTAPTNTNNLGRWRPVSSFPLPTQEVQGDIIDLKYEIRDAGSQRDLQNEARGPVLSRPDNIVPLACPTEWAPNASIWVTPFYQNIDFSGSGESPVAPTAGTLYCALIGYRIVNL